MIPLTRQPAERLIFAGIAVALLVLGAPQAADSVLRLAGGLDEDMPAAIAGPMRPVLARRAALLEGLDEKFGDPRARIRAGLLRLRLAMRPEGGLVDETVKAAADDLRQGLARAPADPLAWTALAHADLTLGDTAGARRALGLSLSTAPYDPALTLSRCQVGLALWGDLSEKERKQIGRQIAQAWTEQPRDLLTLARAGFRETIAAALENTGQRQDFEKAFAGP